MKIVRLYGDMGKRFGREFVLDVKSPAEAVRALCSQVQGFRAYMHAHAQSAFKVFVGSRNASEESALPCSDREVIRITPVIQGASAAGRIILGAALIALAVWNPVFLGMSKGVVAGVMGYGVAMVLGGVVELLTPQVKTTSTGESVTNTPSYNFNGPVNTEAQGHPVPLAYGKLIVGSAVISAGVTTV